MSLFQPNTAQHSVPELHRDNAPEPRASAGAIVVRLAALKWSYTRLKQVPSKWRDPVPPTSPHQGATRRVTPAVRQLC